MNDLWKLSSVLYVCCYGGIWPHLRGFICINQISLGYHITEYQRRTVWKAVKVIETRLSNIIGGDSNLQWERKKQKASSSEKSWALG